MRLLAASLLALSCASAGAGEPDVSLLERLGKTSESRDAAACWKNFSVPAMLLDAPAPRRAWRGTLDKEIIEYFAQRAAAEGEPGPCAALRSALGTEQASACEAAARSADRASAPAAGVRSSRLLRWAYCARSGPRAAALAEAVKSELDGRRGWADPGPYFSALEDRYRLAVERTTAPYSSCETGFSVKGLLSAMAAGAPAPVDTVELMWRFVYRDLGGAGDACGALAAKGLDFNFNGPEGEPLADFCRGEAGGLRFMRAVGARDPALPRACEEALAQDLDLSSATSRARAEFCRQDFSRVPEVCDKLPLLFERNGLLAERRRLCLIQFRSLEEGDARGCGAIDDEEDRKRCPQYAAFYRARKAHDPALCAGRWVCAAFMGQAALVSEAWAERVKAAYCSMNPNSFQAAAKSQ